MNRLIVLLFLACASLADAVGTQNTVILGYKFTVDSTPYRGLSLDCAQIRSSVQARNYAAANTIYTSGKNMKTSTGTKSLKSVSTAVRTGESYYDAFAGFYKGPNYIERTLLGGAGVTPAVGLERAMVACQWLLLSYVGHELDVAKKLITTNTAEAVEEIDDAFAIWYGYPSAPGLWNHNSQAEKWIPCAGPINARVAATFKALKGAALSKNQANFNTQLAAWNKLTVAVYLRSIAYAGTKSNAALQRSAFGYLKVIQPLLAGKAQAQAAQLSTILGGAALANPATVKTLVQSLATLQGVAPKDAGIC